MCYPKAPRPTMRYALAQHVGCGEQVSKSANATECKTIPTVTPGAGVQETGNGRARVMRVGCFMRADGLRNGLWLLPPSVSLREERAGDGLTGVKLCSVYIEQIPTPPPCWRRVRLRPKSSGWLTTRLPRSSTLGLCGFQ